MDREELDNITAPFLASDLAVEVRNVYFEHAGTGIGPGAATAAVFDAFRNLLDDPNEGPVIFLALAALQLQSGQLLDPIRDAALALIESGDAARAWRPFDVTTNLARREALANFAALLSSGI